MSNIILDECKVWKSYLLMKEWFPRMSDGKEAFFKELALTCPYFDPEVQSINGLYVDMLWDKVLFSITESDTYAITYKGVFKFLDNKHEAITFIKQINDNEKIQIGENTIKENIQLHRDVGITASLPSTYTKDEKSFKKYLVKGLLIDRLKILHDLDIKYPNQENNTQKEDDFEYIKIKRALNRNEIGLRSNGGKQLISFLFGDDFSTINTHQQNINILQILIEEERHF